MSATNPTPEEVLGMAKQLYIISEATYGIPDEHRKAISRAAGMLARWPMEPMKEPEKSTAVKFELLNPQELEAFVKKLIAREEAEEGESEKEVRGLKDNQEFLVSFIRKEHQKFRSRIQELEALLESKGIAVPDYPT